MGMFDYIRCRMPLPSEPAPPETEWFQTKSTPTFQLFMERWTIEADGRLVKLGYTTEDRSDPNAVGIMRLCGMATSVYDEALDQAVPHHGDIDFYELNSKTGEWWEYTARFTDGKCVKVWLSDHTPASSSETAA